MALMLLILSNNHPRSELEKFVSSPALEFYT